MFLKNSLFLICYFLFVNISFANNVFPDPITWEKNVKQLLYDDDELLIDGSKIMKLETPYRALDASIVPITVSFNENQKENDFIKSLTIIVDENPSPVVGKFEFSLALPVLKNHFLNNLV